MYKRVLLKLSGEALGSSGNSFDVETLKDFCGQIKNIVDSGVEVGIVVGGGNFVRGKSLEKLGMERIAADKMGMLGTVLNALALESCLKSLGVNALAMSAISCSGVSDIDVELARKTLDNKGVVIFGGGIGNPYFSTDTACALRATQIKADIMLMAKNGVDGVYNDDPDKNPNAKRYDVMTFDDIINMNLQVIDLTAAIMAKSNNLKAFIFDMNAEGNLEKAVKGQAVGTIVEC